MSEPVAREELPWEQLGEHFPQVIDALIFRDCMEERCEHLTEDCPTHQQIVCGGEACWTYPVIGEVGQCASWPCKYAPGGDSGGE